MDIKMIGKVARNKLMQDLFSAFQRQLNLSEEEISKFRHEAFLVESNEEQILKWENFMNLEEKPDYSLQDRIDRVLFTLQSRGSFTPEFLKEQARIFMNGIIDVEELFNEYSFTVVFKDIVGVPPNLENFKAMLELNKPAHLTYKFKFRYNTHGQLEILTHGDMEQYTHDELYQKRVFDDSQLPESPFLAKAVRKVKEVAKLIFPLKTEYYNVDIFNDNFRYLDEHKLEKGGYTGTAKNLNDEISKKASTEQLGRIKVGKNLTITEDGTLSGNPQYTHPTGAGYNHIPAGGVVGQVLKNNGDGSAEWGDLSLDNYYNKGEIDSKFKKYCPVRVGDILLTSSTENPAETYLGTTWELLPDNKFLKTGTTPLQQNGSNSISILKENLPAEKLQIDSFQLGKGTQEITGNTLIGILQSEANKLNTYGGAFCGDTANTNIAGMAETGNRPNIAFRASRSWTGMSTSASPSTTNMGSGTPITINPEHITIKAWKRLT